MCLCNGLFSEINDVMFKLKDTNGYILILGKWHRQEKNYMRWK